MTYSTPTILKAVGAAVVALITTAATAAGGPDLSHLSLDQWLGALTPALVAAMALLHNPNKSAAPTTPAATVTDIVASAATAHTALVQQAVDGIQKVQAATGQLTSLLPASVQPAVNTAETVVSDVETAVKAVNDLGPLALEAISRAGKA